MANVDPDERAKFGALADAWWDTEGPERTLHDINPARLAYVASRCALPGARLLDVGCGGGLLSEALARAGAEVSALDASSELIAVAREHAAAAGLSIDYRVGLVEDLARRLPRHFDAVVCMELLEHVPDADAVIGACAALLRPGGTLVLSTLTRSPRAWLLGVVAAEYVLGLLPRGTHDYARFLRPSELAASARRHGLEVTDISALAYDPLRRRARVGGTPRVNYLATCILPTP